MALSRAKMDKIAAQKRRELFYDGGYGDSRMDGARYAFLRTGDVMGIRTYLPSLLDAAQALNDRYGDLGLSEPT